MRPPTATITAPRRTRSTSITLRLHGSDTSAPGVMASGVSRFRILRAVGGRAPTRILTTTRTVVKVRVRPRALYSFYVQAIDRAGNVEPLSAAPLARVRVVR